MNLPFYSSSKAIRKSPNERYLEQKQAEINSMWHNSTQNEFYITMQESLGSKVYHRVDVSVDMAIDIGTGYKKGDDFKVFSHRDIMVNPITGILYWYANNYWIVTNTSKLASPTSSSEVRRCNNVLKWIDPQSGAVIQEPCVVDYELSSPSPQRDKDVVVANGHCLVICQGNDRTLKFEKNQRFVINGQPFKLSAINDLQYDDVDVDTSTLLYLDMYLDIIDHDDDLVNDIANTEEYNYFLELNQIPTKQVSGFEGVAIPLVMLDGHVVERDVIWSGNEYVTINENGHYEIHGDVSDVAKIVVSLAENPKIYNVSEIEIVEVVDEEYEIAVHPDFQSIRQGESIEFKATLFVNGIEQDDEVVCIPSNVSQHKYTLLPKGDNTFLLTNNAVSKEPLVLTFSANEYVMEKNVKLLSYF